MSPSVRFSQICDQSALHICGDKAQNPLKVTRFESVAQQPRVPVVVVDKTNWRGVQGMTVLGNTDNL